MAYYAHAALTHWRTSGEPLNVVVPTGNLGNALACLLARRCGLPIGDVVLANNANDALARFFDGQRLPAAADHRDPGQCDGRRRTRTISNACSGCIRMPRTCATPWMPTRVDDDAIRATIVSMHRQFGETVCPHTACALAVLQRLRARGAEGTWCVVATAHPAKFPDVVEPLIGAEVPLPAALAAMLAKPSHADPLARDAVALRAVLRNW